MHHPPNLLLVDDEATLRAALACRLQGISTSLTPAALRRLMQTLEKSPIDIVCTDVDMPGTMDGLDSGRESSRDAGPRSPC